jgi:hypothetical protein
MSEEPTEMGSNRQPLDKRPVSTTEHDTKVSPVNTTSTSTKTHEPRREERGREGGSFSLRSALFDSFLHSILLSTLFDSFLHSILLPGTTRFTFRQTVRENEFPMHSPRVPFLWTPLPLGNIYPSLHTGSPKRLPSLALMKEFLGRLKTSILRLLVLQIRFHQS